MADNYIRKVRVHNLYGEKSTLEMDFSEGVNCLYGVNGSGKTTIINLITSCLSCDLEALAKIDFSSIVIFVTKSGNKRPFKFMSVSKLDAGDIEEDSNYNKRALEVIKKTMKGNIDLFGRRSVNNFNEEFFSFEIMDEVFIFPSLINQVGIDVSIVTEKISENIRLTHLPLTRIHASEAFNLDDEYELISNLRRKRVSSQDIIRLLDTGTQVLARIEKDFSELYRRKQDEVNSELEELKQKILNRLLIEKKQLNISVDEVLKKAMSHKYDLSDISNQLEQADIFPEKERVFEHFAVWELAIRELEEIQNILDKGADNTIDHDLFRKYVDAHSRALAFASTVERFFDVIDDVKDMQTVKDKKMAIFKDFKNIANQFLHNKTLDYNKDMSFIVRSNKKDYKNRKNISLSDLSSGEKHVIAILGRVALQENESSVFVADEPELSLHLEWQRKILPAVKSISPSIQIIVATHSPAIIPKSAKMIDIEECFNYV